MYPILCYSLSLYLRDQDSLTIEIYCSYVQIVSQNYVALQKVQEFCLLQEPHQIYY